MIDPPSQILIGIGANLPSAELGSPRATCEAALEALQQEGLVLAGVSNWYKSAPVPASSQPWYVNGVIAVQTAMSPAKLMALMAAVEGRFGRIRGQKNAARTLDLDLIAYGDTVMGWDSDDPNGLTLPHRRMHERGFVLLPLQEIAPQWCHPVMKLSLQEMIAALDPNQQTIPDE